MGVVAAPKTIARSVDILPLFLQNTFGPNDTNTNTKNEMKKNKEMKKEKKKRRQASVLVGYVGWCVCGKWQKNS
jgi:hypothetical protein